MQWKGEEMTNVDSFQCSLLSATTINIKLMVINYPELHRAMKNLATFGNSELQHIKTEYSDIV